MMKHDDFCTYWMHCEVHRFRYPWLFVANLREFRALRRSGGESFCRFVFSSVAFVPDWIKQGGPKRTNSPTSAASIKTNHTASLEMLNETRKITNQLVLNMIKNIYELNINYELSIQSSSFYFSIQEYSYHTDLIIIGRILYDFYDT